MLNFNSIDVETANPDQSSICQIGIVRVRESVIKDQWSSFVNPQEWFEPFHVSIHGIDESAVAHSPTFPEVCEELRARLDGSVLVCHTPFDRIALNRAMMKHNLEQLQVTWLDSAKIVRRAWPNIYGRSGYGLKNVAKNLGISFSHHDALEDARAAAETVLHACASTEIDIEGWLRRVESPIHLPSCSSSPRSATSVKREGNLEGALFGETILFTGALNISRKDAADIAARLGCDVVTSASKRVTMLVVGNYDMANLRGYKKSSKHRKVESFIAAGSDIRILSESDFTELERMYTQPSPSK